MNFLSDLAVRTAFCIAMQGLALVIIGSLSLVLSTGASPDSGRSERPWRWWGWFAMLKGLAVIGSLALGVADANRSAVYYEAFYLCITLPAWLAGAQFAWLIWRGKPAWAKPFLPAAVWLGCVTVTAFIAGWAGLGRLAACRA